jgi:plastocyanin
MGVGTAGIGLVIGVAALVGLGAGVAGTRAVAAPMVAEVAAQARSTASMHVSLDEYAFGPAELAAPTGTVRLQLANGGIRRHNMVVLVDEVEVDSPYLRPGETVMWELELERPGTYQFWCAEYRHLEKGMTGSLTIE